MHAIKIIAKGFVRIVDHCAIDCFFRKKEVEVCSYRFFKTIPTIATAVATTAESER